MPCQHQDVHYYAIANWDSVVMYKECTTCHFKTVISKNEKATHSPKVPMNFSPLMPMLNNRYSWLTTA